VIDTIYIEKEARNDAVTLAILERLKHCRIIDIERYGEVFNPNTQNFRLQKLKPALILARKHSRKVLPTPSDYGIGGQRNYYFSHMMNCIYDCRYCFLQGMYPSSNYVVFTNYNDFFDDIVETSNQHPDEASWFFSGYDCDSLALEPVTEFMQQCLDLFESLYNQDRHSKRENSEGTGAHLEIRTKSTQIRSLLKRQALPNCVVAYSLSPEAIVESLEHKTPSLEKRIDALYRLQQAGWPIGLRFDPLIAADNFQSLYRDMFDQVFSRLDCELIHSVSLGTFRLPKPFHKKITRLYPEEPMFAVPMHQHNRAAAKGESAMIGYLPQIEHEMMQFCEKQILRWIDSDRLFHCVETSDSDTQQGQQGTTPPMTNQTVIKDGSVDNHSESLSRST